MSTHLTEDQICGAVAGQSTLDEQQHLRECEACRDEVNGSSSLIAAFRAGVIATAERHAHATRPTLLPATAVRRTWERGFAATAIAAVLSVAAWRAQQPDLGGSSAGTRDAAATGQRDRAADPSEVVTSEFFPLTYSTVPVSEGRLVRLEVPGTALAAFGLDTARSSPDAVLADVVVGEDGLARAVRFIFPLGDDSTPNDQKERTP
jgi:hypothetical protein